MATYTFDQAINKDALLKFFSKERATLSDFGIRVNQTFEAFVFASTIKWYKENGWNIGLVNPIIDHRERFRLKFSTRGRPDSYSYCVCSLNGEVVQIRHSLRVATKAQIKGKMGQANICCDVVVLEALDLSGYSTSDPIPNAAVHAFGEAKHFTNAYAELVAGFIGLVFELRPVCLHRVRTTTWGRSKHLSPFLYVSGNIKFTAEGLMNTIKKRRFDVDIYYTDAHLVRQLEESTVI
jgi:hypothetical protein